MHDIRAIRDDPEGFDAGLKRRGLEPMSAGILEKDAELRNLLTRLQQAQARRNEASKQIGQAKARKDEATAQSLMAEVAGLKDEIQSGEDKERELKKALDDILAAIPNLPAEDVPDGADETANVEVRRFGEAPRKNNPQEHFELGEALGLMDFEAAARMSGARFVVLKGQLAKLERAIASFMLDLHTGRFGYEEIVPPFLVRDAAMYGTGQLPKFEDDLFKSPLVLFREPRPASDENTSALPQFDDPETQVRFEQAVREAGNWSRRWRAGEGQRVHVEKNIWLIPTAEVPLTNLVREEIIDEAELPLRYTAYTPCFRAEAGAAGRDTRGMIRMHQFSKVELVSITTPEKSAEEHERMTECAEEVLKRLGLHFRTMVLCTGDMGFAAKKTYDIEVWLPGQNMFREISSCSNCGDFQARRMNTRTRSGDDRPRFVHTLNGSGLAVGRTMVAIMENFQNEDGSIAIPEALVSYMGGATRIDSHG
jgi:seryl-tRNA synthetase